MLKDALQQLLKDPEGKAKECKLGKIIASQESDTAELLIEALAGEASTMGLVRTLGAEGINLSREYLGEKRATCFKNPESAKNCCLVNRTKES